MLTGARTPRPWQGLALGGLSWADDDDGGGGGLVVAVHGITASAAAWTAVAPRLLAAPGAAAVSAVVAPELRGRGASRHLPGPWGLARHADDLAAEVAALLDAAGGRRAALVGHSMGAFTLAALATRHPGLLDRLAGTVLVDGALPLEAPAGSSPAAAASAALGPALARLQRTFADPAEHRALWAAHPALQRVPVDVVDAYAARDLVEVDGGGWRVPVVSDAVTQDMADLYEPDLVVPGLERLAARGAPLLTCPRGLDDGAPLYSAGLLARWRERLPGLRVTEVAGTNHYSVLFADAAAGAVAAAVLSTLTDHPDHTGSTDQHAAAPAHQEVR
ncbi:alpha/beta fold hydrolase [Quadrisphaera sp. KR29]|uniref:alpha/beta fold hydrolase n=1 Tax=Quadrisphaera sp. KR29 TaxID=3461391 RepID=UPI0040440179